MTRNFGLTLGVSALALFVGLSTFASSEKKSMSRLNEKGQVEDSDLLAEAPFQSNFYPLAEKTPEERALAMKASEKNRSPADTKAISSKAMSPKLTGMLNDFFATSTPEKLEELLLKWNSDYELKDTPNDAKFLIATFAPYHAFRGIVQRAKPLFYNKANFIHSALLTKVKGLATKTNIYLPEGEGHVVFDYISSPYLGVNGAIDDSKYFKTEKDLQKWLVNELLPILKQSASRLESLQLSTPIVWDQRLIFGKDSFKDGSKQLRWIGEFEKQLSLAGIYQGIASICVTRSYSMLGAVKLAKNVGMEYGLDGVGPFRDVEGGSSMKVVGVIRAKKYKLGDDKVQNKPEYETLFRSHTDAVAWMGEARKANAKSFEAFKTAWDGSAKERHDEDVYLVNTGFFNVNRKKVADNLDMIDRIIHSNGVESLRSAVTGEVIQINYSKLFSDPPNDWKYYLPRTFDENETTTRQASFKVSSTPWLPFPVFSGKEIVKPEFKSFSAPVTYRNYTHGAPKTWAVVEYQKYFPSVVDDSDIPRTLRVLSHAGGSWLSFTK